MVKKGGCLGWLQERTNLEKTLLSVSTLLLLTLLLLILFGIAFKGGGSDNSREKDGGCWTSECIQTAGEILSNMDPDADSCLNFYDFSCGRYGLKPGQTSSSSRRSTDSAYFTLKNLLESPEELKVESLRDVRSFYNSCVAFGSYVREADATGQALLNLMSEVGIGVWPILDPNYDINKFSLEHTLASLILLDVPVVFQMEIVPDELLTGSYLIKISPARPRESGRSWTDIRDDGHLKSSILTSLLLLGIKAASINTEVVDILSVDSMFAKIEQDNSTKCDVNLLAPQEVEKELNRLMPEVDWRIILSDVRNATGLVRPFAVELHCKQKIRNYLAYLHKDIFPKSETNYLGWRFYSKFVEHVIPTFQQSRSGTEEIGPRWRACLELMEKFASPLLADVLTEKMLTTELQKEVEKIARAAVNATQQLISRARWLSEPQKHRIHEKVARIQVRYPFQKRTLRGDLPIHIPKVEVSEFTSAVIHLQRQWVIQRFKRLNQESESRDTEIWIPLMSSESDSPLEDYVVPVHFDKVTSPFFRLYGPDWFNYGGLGVFVSRQISRVLMSLYAGELKEESSTLWYLWINYKNSSMCLLRSHVSRLAINAEELPPLVENIMQTLFLDRSSVEIAYESAKSAATASKSSSLPGLDLSDQKMFFLSHAQTLCDVDAPSEASASTIRLKDSARQTSESEVRKMKCQAKSQDAS